MMERGFRALLQFIVNSVMVYVGISRLAGKQVGRFAAIRLFIRRCAHVV